MQITGRPLEPVRKAPADTGSLGGVRRVETGLWPRWIKDVTGIYTLKHNFKRRVEPDTQY